MTRAAKIKRSVRQLQDVLSLFVLDKGCLHARLGMALANPFCSASAPPPPCQTRCFVCLGRYKDLFWPVNQVQLTAFLVSDWWYKKGPMRLHDLYVFMAGCKKIPATVFGVNRSSTAAKKKAKLFRKRHIEALVLQLLATGILEPYVERNLDRKGYTTYVRLGITDGTPNVNVATFWEHIPVL